MAFRTSCTPNLVLPPLRPMRGPTPSAPTMSCEPWVDAIHARGMYVIFDIVLNHTGNVFGYVRAGQDNAPDAPFQDAKYQIRWHDQQGAAAFADFSQAPHPLVPDAAVWPVELQDDRFFRRQGKGADLPRAKGDFESLKQMVSENAQLDRVLIRAYQYVIARFDCDGFRIDTFKLPDPAFGHTFCAAMREFALIHRQGEFLHLWRNHHRRRGPDAIHRAGYQGGE